MSNYNLVSMRIFEASSDQFKMNKINCITRGVTVIEVCHNSVIYSFVMIQFYRKYMFAAPNRIEAETLKVSDMLNCLFISRRRDSSSWQPREPPVRWARPGCIHITCLRHVQQECKVLRIASDGGHMQSSLGHICALVLKRVSVPAYSNSNGH